MLIDLEDLSPNRVYHTLIQSVVPRPIAWVLSSNDDGGHNLAPFSYFNLVCSDPPLLMLSIGKKSDGATKDTRRNIVERGAFVVHIAHAGQAHLVSESSMELEANDSELQRLQLPTVLFGSHPVPRLRDCRIAFACERYQVMELGPLPQALILGRITSVYIDDAIVAADASGRLHIDVAQLDPLARSGGDQYATLGEVLDIPRPR